MLPQHDDDDDDDYDDGDDDNYNNYYYQSLQIPLFGDKKAPETPQCGDEKSYVKRKMATKTLRLRLFTGTIVERTRRTQPNSKTNPLTR